MGGNKKQHRKDSEKPEDDATATKQVAGVTNVDNIQLKATDGVPFPTNWLKKVLFLDASKVVWYGSRHPHTPESLFLAQSGDTCDVYDKFHAIWLKTKGKTETARLGKAVIKFIKWPWIGSFVLSLIA